ncbi:uncharacterized protein [Spinacia oleracea]|uniref:UBC core domain-containing protein n=1 Tax=Spinacia oleracea TaxID=3562 RepID=A0ABM3RIC7_SPIOL|nr:uncharacterized protein LOC130469877 [Spinacia oleracea]
MVLTEAAKEGIWLKELVIVYCDSLSAICLAKDQVHHERTKHTDVRYHFLRSEKRIKELLIALLREKSEAESFWYIRHYNGVSGTSCICERIQVKVEIFTCLISLDLVLFPSSSLIHQLCFILSSLFACNSHVGGGTFVFTFQVQYVYPYEPPKVKSKTKVYHPNIDLEGNVCLNILREDWKHVLNVNIAIYGLYHLFTQPNYEDPLNHDATVVLRDNPKMYESNVRSAMAGGYVSETFFRRCVS